MKIIWVKWHDAHGQPGPISLDALNRHGPLTVVSAGILAGEDDEVIRFSTDYYRYEGFNEDLLRSTMVIAKKNIIEMKTFNVPDYGSK